LYTSDIKAYVSEELRRVPADYAEVRLERSSRTSIRLRGPIRENIEQTGEFGGAVRVLVGGAWGFCSFNTMEELIELESQIRQAVKLAQLVGRWTGEKRSLAPVHPVREEVRPRIVLDPTAYSLAHKVGQLEEYNSLVLDYGGGITSSEAVYQETHVHSLFMSSEGAVIDQVKLDVAGFISALAARDGITQVASLRFGTSDDFGVLSDLHDQVKERCELATALLDAPVIQGGEYSVICAPQMAGVFMHEAFGHLSEFDSTMHDRRLCEIMTLGRRFGGKNLTVYDTGRAPGGRGHLLFDDEGVRAEPAYLIREGVLVGRLHSRESAATVGEKPTGNARALNYQHSPICRMRNTCIEPGAASLEDLLAGVERGVYVDCPYGGQTNGEMFTFAAGESYLIENGKLGRLVRGVNLTGNVFETLARIDLIGSDSTLSNGGCGKAGQMPLPVSMTAPHIRIKSAVVGGK